MRSLTLVLGLALLSVLAACSEREEILPGERLDLRAPNRAADDGAAVADAPPANRAVAIALGRPVVNADWTHKAGGPQHRIDHPALGATLTRVWSASIGQGESRKHRITADPVIADGRIFTLDSRARVMAHSTDGAPLWSRDLTPASDKADDASGGGLATANGVVYVTTGFGALVALDAETGAERWRQDLDAAATGAPTVLGDLVYLVSRDSRAWAVDVETGRIRWQVAGSASAAGITGGPAPAVNDSLAIFPFSSGELLATLRQGGVRAWSASVAGQRDGTVYALISDIQGDPVIAGGRVYAANQSGRTVALDVTTGERLWTATEGALSPVWVAGGSVFLVSDRNEVLRLDADTGDRIWGVELPFFVKERERRRRDVYAYYGPILAGGRLLVASSDGLIRSFNPEDGALISTLDLPGGAATNPVVANNTLYIVSKNGQLQAFR